VLPNAPLTAPTSVPPFTVVVPPKLVAAPNVNVSAPLFTSDPFAPVIVPTVLPAATVNTVVPRFNVPPVSALTLEVAALRFKTPPLTVPSVAMPPTVREPPLISDVNMPKTLVVPSLIPPLVTMAFEPNRVFPAPEREVSVIVPIDAVKYRLLSLVFALATAESDRPEPLKTAKPFEFKVKDGAEL